MISLEVILRSWVVRLASVISNNLEMSSSTLSLTNMSQFCYVSWTLEIILIIDNSYIRGSTTSKYLYELSTRWKIGMEIRTKLFASFLAMGILLGTAGYLFYNQISEVNQSTAEVQKQASTIIALGSIESDFEHLNGSVLAYVLHASEASTEEELQLAQDHFDEVQQTKTDLFASYEQYKTLETDSAAVDTIGENLEHVVMIGDEMVAAAAPSTAGEATTSDHMAAGADTGVLPLHRLVLEFDEQSMIFRDELNQHISANFAEMQAKQANVLVDIQNTLNFTMLLTASAIAVVVVIGSLVAFSISKRVIRLKKQANIIAQGSLEEEIHISGSDEITDLASNFEHMRKNLVKAQEELKHRNEQLQDLNAVLENANNELKQLDRMKDEFIGVASHELRSPIHPILGYASMAREGMMGSKEALDVIYKQAVRLRQLATDVLDVSRIESGSLPYTMRKIDIQQVLANCVEAIKPNVSSAVTLATDFEKQQVEMVGDSERLTQVFTNLLGNALKFTKKGKISVETSIARPDSLVITISDTGGGIPKEILPKLFNKFVTKKVGDDVAHGTGLGLFISKSIVEAHGGRISAYNNETGGASFKIELPLNKDEEDVRQPPIAVRAE